MAILVFLMIEITSVVKTDLKSTWTQEVQVQGMLLSPRGAVLTHIRRLDTVLVGVYFDVLLIILL